MILVKKCHLVSRQVEVIGKENKSTLGLLIKILNSAQFLRIILGYIKPCQFADLVLLNAAGFIDLMGNTSY